MIVYLGFPVNAFLYVMIVPKGWNYIFRMSEDFSK